MLARPMSIPVGRTICLGGMLACLAATPALGGTSSEQQLADRYAPIVALQDQKKECGKGEPYKPISVDAVLGNPEIELRGPGSGHPVVKTGPTAADLFGKGAGYYLDLPGNPLSPGCTYEKEARRWNGDRAPVAYAHIATEEGRPGELALQYWFYYVFNDFNNKHESDWEMIQLVFPAADASAALKTKPSEVAYSQHEGGERAAWDDPKLERDGNHPIAYAAAGSHANYYSSALWLGRGGSEGFGCDDTSDDSTRTSVRALVVPTTVASSAGPYAWLGFTGRWGQYEPGFNNGPTGPSTKAQWLEPIRWQEDSRDASVPVPAVKTLGPSISSFFCAAVRAGSNALLFAEQKPWVALALVLLVVGFGVGLIRRTRWSPVETIPLREPRGAGQILRVSSRLYRKNLRLFLGIGAAFLPLGALFAGIQALLFGTWLKGLVDLAGNRSLVSAALGIEIGGLGVLVAAVLVVAASAVALAEIDRGRKPRVRDCYRTVFSRFRDLFLAVGRAAVVTVLLSLTVVGIPLAVQRLVRWSFLPQSVLDGRAPRAASQESARLVRGSWWRTFGLTATINVSTLLTALLVGLAFLFLVSSVSLSFIDVIGSVVFALAYPYVGIATTLLFFDRVATGPSEPSPARLRFRQSRGTVPDSG